jgi:hypothetical protein
MGNWPPWTIPFTGVAFWAGVPVGGFVAGVCVGMDVTAQPTKKEQPAIVKLARTLETRRMGSP